MYFEDITVGSSIKLSEVTVDNDEMIGFARRYNPVPFHTDEEYASKNTKPGRVTASGLYTFALMWAEYVVNDFGGEQTLAGTAMRLEFKAPVFAGNRLRGEAAVISKAERNPYNGIFTVRIDVFNGDDTLVLTAEADTVVKRKRREGS